MAFVHLHTHSCYSILDGKSRPKEIVSVAKKLGQNAVALTDHGVMHGVVEFYNEAKEQGIKPIIGCEVYVAPNSRFDKVGAGFKGEGGKNYYHLILLAETQQGYKNLLKIVSAGFTDGYYYKPRVDKELLEKYHEGLICTSACIGGIVPQTLLGDTFTGSVSSEDYEKAKEEAIWYRDTFGPNNYFIELQNHGIPEQLLVNPYLEKIAKEIGVKCIVANDAHYPERKDAKAHEVMLCIQTKAFLTDEDRFKFSSDDFYIKSEEEMIALFPGKQEYLDNTQEIADRCNVSFEFDGYKLPKFPVPKEYENNHGEYLKKICRDNFKKFYPDKSKWTKEHEQRFNEEFKVISEMGFIDYFLIVWNYINWAKEKGIFVGPSRGCTSEETLIYTEYGLKEIKDILIGDRVYTHDGTLKNVLNTMIYDTPDEELIKPVVYFGGKQGDYYTKDHKVFAVRQKRELNKRKISSGYKYLLSDKNPSWIPVSELNIGDLIAFPKLKNDNKNIIYELDLTKYINNKSLYLMNDKIYYKRLRNTPYEYSVKNVSLLTGVNKTSLNKFIKNKDHNFNKENKEKLLNFIQKNNNIFKDIYDWRNYVLKNLYIIDNTKNKLVCNEDLMLLLGLYTGDGWITKNKRNTVSLAVNGNNPEAFYVELIRKVFGEVNIAINKNSQKNVYTISFESPIIKNFIKDFWEKYNYKAYTKSFPSWIYKLDNNLKKAFLKGLWMSDGSSTVNKKCFDSTSWDLISGVKILLSQLNIPNSLSKRYARIDNRQSFGYCRDSWKITIPVKNINQLKKQFCEYDDNYIYKRIYRFDKKIVNKVYDICVEDNHSYVTNSFAAHNSAAGSLICYLMGITSLTDPVEYGLLFERFLNKERVSMPDIDTDFQKDRREDVIQHVRELYGNDKVSNIVAIGTMKAKAALKDVCRVYQIPFEISNKLSKLIPSIPDITLKDAWKESPKLVEFIQSDKKYQEIWDMALQIEGLPRNISVHASGVIICDDKIAEYAPMMTVDGQTVVQFPMEVVEKIGLIKMDFLGLRTLDIFDYASRFIHKEKDKDFDISKISLNDMGVYDYLSSGNTSSVFQFESSGMTKYMKQLKPHSIEELAALNALYRPGPMDFIPDYIRNKNNPANITYALDTPEVRKILGNTYGLCTYQEQIMLIFQHVAGFTLGRADLVRKAMGKKKEKIMLEEFEHFKNGLHDEKNNIIGTRAKGIPDEAVDALLNQMKDFSKYAFNKSHAVAYSVVAYQTAWLKYHYPTEFMAATISSFIGKNDEIGKSISDALDMGLKLIPPRINESTNLFTPLKDGEILFSLNGIKNVGDKVANAIIEERELNGPFKSFFDFLSRTKKYSIGDSTIEALIKVNAFDFTGESRATLIENLSTFSKIAKESHQRKSNGQRSIFSLLSTERAESLSMPELIKYEDDKRVITEWEKELTSIYITYDPLEDFNFYLKDKQVYSPDRLIKAFKNGEQIPGNNIFMIGMVGDTGEFQTKKGTFMAKPILESKTASVPCVVFPKMYSRADFEPIKNKGIPIIISARISDNSEEENLELIVNKVSVIQSNDYFKSAGNRDNIYSVLPEGFGLSPVDGSKGKKMANTQGVVATTEVKGKPKGLYINVKEKELNEVIEYLYNNHGKTKTFLFIDKTYVRTNILVSATNELQGYLKDKLGQNNVWFNS